MPGAGKGIYGMLRLIDVLRSTDHHIITNLAVELNPWVRRLSRKRRRGEKGLLAHLLDTYGETFDAETRVHIIPNEDVKFFYLHRIRDGKLIKIEPVVSGRGKGDAAVIGFDPMAFEITEPCTYFIDEAGTFWGSRNWQSLAPAFGVYSSQHRKAGDEVWFMFQHVSQVDKQMRILIDEWHSCVNHKFRKIMMFRQPERISVVVTNEPPDMRAKGVGIPKVIGFDKEGIGASYDTAKGAGVQGLGADILKKAHGMPWWMIIVAMMAGGMAIIFAARGSGWVFGKLLTGGFNRAEASARSKKTEVVGVSNAFGIPLKTAEVLSERQVAVRPGAATEVHNAVDGGVYLNGLALVPMKGYVVMLSNGECYESWSGEGFELTRNYVIINGKEYRWKNH